ncbi:hydantoinase/oxoprolinase family protein [Pararhizobium sp. YC-54]|uniref:hydantoinase/oxoprolinase family protein n=1 Tax=Pararhizobium sp. YC-54 TaxID=2986920 RepID=UPI0021F7ADFC|nr:hydantoinase/oxoprolinase family protein [Pararhizobium sp. YC-54]MCV9999744.1 hydantoinase/oxoprolinase family protein [Pararhizobium sp. YC-54]
MSTKTIRVATDVGGTFTDLVCFEMDHATGQSRITTAKSDTTPPNFEQGVLNVLEKGGVDPKTIDFLAHGTTVVINALTERKGVKVGLITTEGFRDSLEIARGNRPDFFNLHYEKPAPFVPRYLRRELPGRFNYHGEEMKPLDLSGLRDILDAFRADGVEAIAVCFLHSYANPSHEQATIAGIKRLWPEIAAVASHQITREWREYERTNTAVMSAYVQPTAERYLSRLNDGLAAKGFDGNLFIMQSNCGVDSLDSVKKIPITMVESGPASGFWGAAELGKLIGEKNVLALDIGGTTAKCSLNHDYFCGGSVTADMPATEKALKAVGEKLGVSADEVARGIVRIANNNMVNALKLVSLNRGFDPRDFTLVAFGGGGAMHAVALGVELGVKKVVIPAGAAVFSAWGMMMSDLRRDYFVTKLAELTPGSAAAIETLFGETEALALQQFNEEGVDRAKVTFLRYGKFRYQNQEHTTEVLIEGGITDARLAGIETAFHETYEREYTYRLDAPVELVGIHLVASAEVGKLKMQERPLGPASASAALKGVRSVDYALEGIHKAEIYNGEKLEPGMAFAGPAVIEDPGTTIVVHPGNHVEVDGFGNIHIHLKA